MGRSGEIGILGVYLVVSQSKDIGNTDDTLYHWMRSHTSEEMYGLTSTRHPSLFILSHSSRDVMTLAVSTAVHVGRIGPSPPCSAILINSYQESRSYRRRIHTDDFIMRQYQSSISDDNNLYYFHSGTEIQRSDLL